jgi:hypothetical protein
MIGVLVTFAQTDELDRSTLAEIAEKERGTFEGMPGLLFKSFTIDDDGQVLGGSHRHGDGDLRRPAQDRILRRAGVRRQLRRLIRSSQRPPDRNTKQLPGRRGRSSRIRFIRERLVTRSMLCPSMSCRLPKDGCESTHPKTVRREAFAGPATTNCPDSSIGRARLL